MTMTSGIFGACFYLLITMHGLHAAAAALTIVYLSIRLTRNTLDSITYGPCKCSGTSWWGSGLFDMGWWTSKEGGPHVWPETSWSVARPDHPWHGITVSACPVCGVGRDGTAAVYLMTQYRCASIRSRCLAMAYYLFRQTKHDQHQAHERVS